MAARATKPLVETPSREEQIRFGAYERYLQRGGEPGSELADWLQAEAEICRAQEQAIEEACPESFPGSDPPVSCEPQHFEFLPRRSI
jgi:Protein of unknown function (DUF2934)